MTVILDRATDPAYSAWVSANAGAGKTYLLTDRVTRLLLSGAKPERILCLTYTKAAAAEMASRLFQRLGKWALLSDDELRKELAAIGETEIGREQMIRARQLFAQALETPGGLKIQTIHSFCQHVLTRFPVEAGVATRFSVLDERSAGELMEIARNEVLQLASHGDARLKNAVALIATRAADGRFADILSLAMANARKLKALLAHHGDMPRLFAHLRATLGVAEGDDEAKIVGGFCAEVAADRQTIERVARWLDGGSDTDKKLSAYLKDFISAGMGADVIHRLEKLFLTDKGPRARLATKPLTQAEPGLFEFINRLQDRFIAMEERRKAVVTAALTEALVTVAFAVLDIYERLKRNRAGLDYDDLIAHTQSLLERADAAAWVLYKLDGGLDHILVDEAQDTSPEQWKIVAKLAEEFFAGEGARTRLKPRTLFAVGDEKQSIFSFQGADPEGFGAHLTYFKKRAEGAGLPFADLRPAVSRRSGRSVLEFVDAVFAHDEARQGVTTSDEPIQHDPHRTTAARVEVWPLVQAPDNEQPNPWHLPVDAPERDSAGTKLAARIAERIGGWLRDGVRIPGTDEPVTPGDIMILVRRRNAFAEEMIRQLIERRIPVAGADRMVLSEQIAIQDLVALGRFALLPEDDLTLAALLKSPLAGLSEDELYDLAQPREKTLWQALVARKDERASFRNAHAILSHALAQADYVAPFEFYARALGQGARKRIVARLGDEAADAMDEFLALALAHESAHPPSLQSFLDWFERGASEVKRDMERAAGAVRVMTVHGAKGLEANIVIVPDTAQIPDHDRQAGILFPDGAVYYGVPKALETAPIAAAKQAAQQRELREYRRLLYVALTRAREWLVLCGYEMRTSMPAAAWYTHLERAAQAHGRKEDIDGEILWAMGAPLATGGAAPKIRGAPPVLPPFLSQDAPAEPAPRILRPSDATGTDELIVSPVADHGEDRFGRGLLIHALFARLPDITPEQRESVALRYLAQQGVDAADARPLVAETLAVIDDPRFAPLFAAGSRAEVALAATLPELGNVRISGQIDRLAVTADTVLIADFKTNRPPPSSVEKTPRFYLAQMALYRAALARIYPGKRIDCVLVWTDGPHLMELPPALLDAEIAAISTRSCAQDVLG